MSLIGVSLLVHDQLPWIEKLDADLRDSDLAKYPHVKVAVDNGSCDPVADYLTAHGWIVLRNPTNVGIIAGRNQSFWRLVAEGATELLELHSDMRLPGYWFKPLWEELQVPDTVMACSRIVTAADYSGDWTKMSRLELENLCIRKRAGHFPDTIYTRKLNHPCLHKIEPFRARGFYDDRLRWQGFEDTDWYIEITRKLRKHVGVSRESVVFHAVAGQRLTIAPTGCLADNEGYLRHKWDLGARWQEELFGEHDKSLCFLSSESFDEGGFMARLAMALAVLGQPVLFMQEPPLQGKFRGPTLRIRQQDAFSAILTRERLAAMVLGHADPRLDHWLGAAHLLGVQKKILVPAGAKGPWCRPERGVPFRFEPGPTGPWNPEDEEGLLADQGPWLEIAREFMRELECPTTTPA